MLRWPTTRLCGGKEVSKKRLLQAASFWENKNRRSVYSGGYDMKSDQSALFRRDFTLVVIGQTISLFGNAVLRFALPLYLLRQTGSAALFGVVGAAAFIPAVLCSPIGGVLADRVNKRNIMVCLDFCTAGLILAFALLLEHIPLVPLMVVCLMLLYGIAGAYQPAVQASIPLLAEPEQLTRANAVINMVGTLSGLLGPVIGGVLFGAFGIRPILWVSVVCFFLSAVMELFIHIPHLPQEAAGGVLRIVARDLAESWRFIRREKPVFLSVMTVLALFNMVLSAALIVGIPVAVVQVLGMSDLRLGITQAAMGLGGLLGGLLAGTLGQRLSPHHGSVCLLGCAGAAGVMGLAVLPGVSPQLSYWIVTAAALLAMSSAMLFTVVLLTLVQAQVPSQLLGKVIACVQAVANCAAPLGQAGYGVLFDYLPPWAVLLGASALSALVALRSRRVFRQLEQM